METNWISDQYQLNNLIVNYLPNHFTTQNLIDLCLSYGPVISAKVVVDKNYRSIGFGFVKFVKKKDAQRAYRTLNGLRLYDKTLKVSYTLPRIPISERAYPMLVKNLPKTVTNDEFIKPFRQFGRIIYARILYYRNYYATSEEEYVSRGTGFVRFERRVDAEEAINALNNVCIFNSYKPIEIKFIKKKAMDLSDQTPVTMKFKIPQLLVHNLPPNFIDAKLVSFFEDYGTVLSVNRVRQANHHSARSAVVRMKSYEEIMNAVYNANNCFFHGRRLKVEYSTI